MKYDLSLTVNRRNYQLVLDEFGRVSYDELVSEWHLHAVYHLILVTAGSFYVEFRENERIRVDRDSLLFINPLVKHRFSSLPRQECEHTTMLWRFVDKKGKSATFPLQRLFDDRRTAKPEPYLICRLTEREALQLENQHQRLLNILRDNSISQPLTLHFYDLWFTFFDLVMQKNGAYPETPFGQLTEQILFALNNAIADPGFSVWKLGQLMGKHPNYLNLRLKQATGQTVGRTLQEMRLVKAAGLLASGRLSVAEIAEQCGYSRSNYFSEAFRRYYGTPPLHFRRNANQLPGFLRTKHHRVGAPEEVDSDGIKYRQLDDLLT